MKSAWKALNVDSDQESEDEVDDTKEIQIEEALKLYQTALKFHSEGPASFEHAKEAYAALFASDIFRYPESFSEYKRHELYGDELVFDSILEDDYEADAAQPAPANDSAPNTLDQILHLSYKNHGQFLLETAPGWFYQQGAVPVLPKPGKAQVQHALNCFAEALDKDDTDLDLWLRIACVAALVSSPRIARFCLEAVLDGDEELFNNILRLPGLAEGFAGQQLRELVHKLEDSLSLMQAPFSSMSNKKLSATLKKRLNPIPTAPLPSEAINSNSLSEARTPPQRLPLTPNKWDWAGVGEAILQHFHAEQGGYMDFQAPGTAVTITIPPDADDEESLESQSPHGVSNTTVGAVEESKLPTSAEDTSASGGDAVATPPDDGQDVIMEEADNNADATAEEGDTRVPQESAPSQSRKRSTGSAGLPETAEGGRSRSKRIRARDSIATDGNAGADAAKPDLAKQLEEKLLPFTHADKCLVEIVNDSLERLGVRGMGSPQELRALLTSTESVGAASEGIDRAACDLYAALQSGGAKVAGVLVSGEPVDLGGMSREAGLNAFLGYAKADTSRACIKPVLRNERLQRFASKINEDWLTMREVAFAWLEMLLCPGSLPCVSDCPSDSKSSYIQYRWAEDLKRHLVQIIVNFDEFIYERLLDRIANIDSAILKARAQSLNYVLSTWDMAQVEMMETIFELHLDIYSLIKHPHSGVDVVTQTTQKDRLERWSALARDAMQLRSECDPDNALDRLALRHIWASVFQMSVNDDTQPEYVLHVMEELKTTLQSLGGPVIEVQNNAVMPELSIAAVDRELARISMKDFFLRVFNQDEKDPVAVIESLEPILEPVQGTQHDVGLLQSKDNDEDHFDSGSSATLSHHEDPGTELQVSGTPASQEMRKFLDTASVHLKLSLWQRLREAYEAIEYPPKVVTCYLRSIETLMAEFKARPYSDSPAPERHIKVLTRLRIIDEILVKTLLIIKNDKTAFDCLSYEHLQASMTVIAELLRILSAANMLEDLIRLGHVPVLRFEGYHHTTFINITTRLHDMQLRAWLLQYYLLKEGISQNSAAFPTPSEDQFEFLRHVHYATGVRNFCHNAGRVFLRLAKDELLRLDDVIDGNTRDTELAQVLYDLYGLKLFVRPIDCQEFASTYEPLDKKSAFQLLPFILSQARKIPIKDLPRSELKVAIDKVHGSLGRPKPNEDISLNRRMLNSFFKSPIEPLSLYECLKGVGSLSMKIIPPEDAVAASKGWYFLMGSIALNKFRSQKRLTQGPTEDLNFAQAFFLQDLEYSVDGWETWYRLAQANDAQLEECVSWTAEKLNSNSNSAELTNFQRAAIHCYTMATACAIREADVAPQSIAKVSDMYTDFGTRVYSSSREPFNMNAFLLKETENKYYSKTNTADVYQSVPFAPLSAYTAWKFAGVLFKRAIQGKPDRWWNHYMLAKCLWKMYTTSVDLAISAAQHGNTRTPKGPSREEVITAIVNAINAAPEKRERGREPILEPHYKLASIVHKLFKRKTIDYKEGERILHNTPYAQNLSGPVNEDDWERYILSVLKALRAADKAGWHHRIVARTAHIIYEDAHDAIVAHAAKHELTQQMFTKTMTVQVWKPEHERPGRHFVYTTRYTRFFGQLLEQTADKANMELLAKRVRRKQHDFYEHAQLWQQLCMQYLRLLRWTGQIPENQEDAVFRSVNHDEFTALAGRLEAWCQDPSTQHPVLDVLRETIELKRLNNGLMKPLLIDDLIGDTYALLYTGIGPQLPPLPSEKPPRRLSQPMIGATTSAPQSGSGPYPVLSSLGQVQVDGAAELSADATVPSSIHPPMPPQVHQQPDTTVRAPRTKPIGRREIQRRAEAASAKPTAPTPVAAPSTTVMAIRSPPTSHVTVVIPSVTTQRNAGTHQQSVSPTTGKADANADGQLQVPGTSNTPAAAVPASIANLERSAPGSIQDDADDESELSELDEEEVREIQEVAGVHDPVKRDDTGMSMKTSFGSGRVSEGKGSQGARDVDAMDED